MKLREMYPSRYATGEDLGGKPVAMTILGVVAELMRPGPGQPEKEKFVIYFQGAKKGVVLSRTLARQIARAVGSDDTEAWTGKKVTLIPEPMTVGGEPRIAIRVQLPAQAPADPEQKTTSKKEPKA